MNKNNWWEKNWYWIVIIAISIAVFLLIWHIAGRCVPCKDEVVKIDWLSLCETFLSFVGTFILSVISICLNVRYHKLSEEKDQFISKENQKNRNQELVIKTFTTVDCVDIKLTKENSSVVTNNENIDNILLPYEFVKENQETISLGNMKNEIFYCESPHYLLKIILKSTNINFVKIFNITDGNIYTQWDKNKSTTAESQTLSLENPFNQIKYKNINILEDNKFEINCNIADVYKIGDLEIENKTSNVSNIAKALKDQNNVCWFFNLNYEMINTFNIRYTGTLKFLCDVSELPTGICVDSFEMKGNWTNDFEIIDINENKGENNG